MFRFLLIRPDGAPNDPGALVTAVPNWSVGEVITLGRGEKLRIVDIETDLHDELVEHGMRGVFTVEPLDEP